MNTVASDEEVDTALIRDAEIGELKKGLACLSERERLLLTMKYLDGASDEDTKRLGTAAASVRTYLTRARRRLCSVMPYALARPAASLAEDAKHQSSKL